MMGKFIDDWLPIILLAVVGLSFFSGRLSVSVSTSDAEEPSPVECPHCDQVTELRAELESLSQRHHKFETRHTEQLLEIMRLIDSP